MSCSAVVPPLLLLSFLPQAYQAAKLLQHGLELKDIKDLSEDEAAATMTTLDGHAAVAAAANASAAEGAASSSKRQRGK